MNIRDYTREAERFDDHKPHRILDALVHGLVAETAEAFAASMGRDTQAFFLELGDVQWNLARLADVLHIPIEDVEEAEQEHLPANIVTADVLAIDLVVHAGKVAGWMEKHHRTPLARPHCGPSMERDVLLTWQRLTWLALISGWSMDVVREGNIRKLAERYDRLGIPRREAS